ncbi:MAG: alpha/beta fold hydrolase [Pyrinomonadaceae bacterium]
MIYRSFRSLILFFGLAAVVASQNTDLTHTEKEVSYINGSVKIAASVFIPDGKGPFPAVVIVHGSGTSSRENQWTSAYATALVKRGVAVLYPDKRGSGKSTGDWVTSDFSDLADDAIAGVEFLKKYPDIDKTRIGVIGFSQGGHVIPVAAANSSSIAFAISISASTVPILEQMIDEVEKMAEREGLDKKQIEVVNDIHRKAIHYGMTGKDFDKYADALDKAKKGELKGKRSVEGFPTDPDHNAFRFGKTVGDYDPIPYWKKVNVPMLFVYGGKDTQIRINKSMNRIENNLGKGDQNYSVLLFHRNGHGIFREDLLDLIARWIFENGDP